MPLEIAQTRHGESLLALHTGLALGGLGDPPPVSRAVPTAFMPTLPPTGLPDQPGSQHPGLCRDGPHQIAADLACAPTPASPVTV